MALSEHVINHYQTLTKWHSNTSQQFNVVTLAPLTLMTLHSLARA